MANEVLAPQTYLEEFRAVFVSNLEELYRCASTSVRPSRSMIDFQQSHAYVRMYRSPDDIRDTASKVIIEANTYVLSLANIEIEPDYRRRGVFTALVRAAEQFCTARSIGLIHENVLSPHVKTFCDSDSRLRPMWSYDKNNLTPSYAMSLPSAEEIHNG